MNMGKFQILFLYNHQLSCAPFSSMYITNSIIVERVLNHGDCPYPSRDPNLVSYKKLFHSYEYVYLVSRHTKMEMKSCVLNTTGRYPKNVERALVSLFSEFCDTI